MEKEQTRHLACDCEVQIGGQVVLNIVRNKGIRIWNELTEDDIRLQSTNWEGTSSVSNTNRVTAWEHQM